MNTPKYDRAKALNDSFWLKERYFEQQKSIICDLMKELCPGSDPWTGDISNDTYMTLRKEYRQANTASMVYFKAWVRAVHLQVRYMWRED